MKAWFKYSNLVREYLAQMNYTVRYPITTGPFVLLWGRFLHQT